MATGILYTETVTVVFKQFISLPPGLGKATTVEYVTTPHINFQTTKASKGTLLMPPSGQFSSLWKGVRPTQTFGSWGGLWEGGKQF